MLKAEDLSGKENDLYLELKALRNRLADRIVDDELLYERIEDVHDHQRITSTRVVKSEAKLCREFPEAENPSRRPLSLLRRLSLLLSLPLRDPSLLSLLLAGAVWWWLQPIGGGGQISPLSCFLVPDLFRSPLPCLLFLDPDL
ncbi:hypothetical protein IGI04_040518, partial [Brassica rapa subsp. trilocularis]